MILHRKGYYKITNGGGATKYIPFAIFRKKFWFIAIDYTFYINRQRSDGQTLHFLLREEDGFSDKWNWFSHDEKIAVNALDNAIKNKISEMESEKRNKTIINEKVYL